MGFRTAVKLCVGGVILALSLSIPASAQKTMQTNLVSDQAGAANNQDILLVNAFGIARGTGTNWMVAARGSAQGIVYDGAGNAQAINVNTPPAVTGGVGQPTGVVFNGTSSFNVPNTTIPAQFLFATADGAIEAYNPNVDPANAFIAVNSGPASCYTGLTIAEVSPGVFNLFAANFKKGRIDVFDGNFKPVTNEEFGSEDLGLLAIFGGNKSLSPYNIQALGPNLVIAFAVRGANNQPVAGSGNGLVVIVTPQGRVVNFIKGSFLNIPYGIAGAPADFGRLSHLLLIGNNGSGQIAAIDTTGFARFVTFVLNSSGTPVIIDGLHALGFGATGAAGDVSFQSQASGAFNSLNFSAGPVGGTHGLLGNLTPILSDFVIGEQ